MRLVRVQCLCLYFDLMFFLCFIFCGAISDSFMKFRFFLIIYHGSSDKQTQLNCPLYFTRSIDVWNRVFRLSSNSLFILPVSIYSTIQKTAQTMNRRHRCRIHANREKSSRTPLSVLNQVYIPYHCHF